jgi:protein TonB
VSEQVLVFAAFAASRSRGRRLGRQIAIVGSVLAHVVGLWALALHRPAPAAAAKAREPEPIVLRLPPMRTRLAPAAAVVASKPERPRPPRVPARLTQPPPMVAPPEPATPEAPVESEAVADGDPFDDSAPIAEVAQPVAAPAGIAGPPVDQVFELREVARPPAVLAQGTPEYPRQARFDRIEGTVVLRVIVGADGRVEEGSIKVVRSVPALDAAAIAAIRAWRFSPALGPSGRPARVVIEVPFQFSLR